MDRHLTEQSAWSTLHVLFIAMIQRRWFCGFSLVLTLSLSPVAHGEEPKPAPRDDSLLEQVVDVWSQRQAKTKTLKAVWHELVINSDDAEPNPLPKPTSQVVTFSLGEKNEMSLVAAPVAGDEGEFRRTETDVTTFDGKRNYTFTSEFAHGNGESWPVGIVGDASVSDLALSVQIRPWLLHERPLGKPAPNLSQNQLRVRQSDVKFRDRRCAILERQSGDRSLLEIFHVDLERQFIILRYEEQFEGVTAAELDIDYKQDPKLGWIPERWEWAIPNNRHSVSGVLLDCQRNVDLPASTFQIDFPRGTIVFDQDATTRSLWLGDGQTRVITPEESAAGFRYQDLFQTKAGELAPRRTESQPPAEK